MSVDERTGREDCYICSRGNPDTLESHHIVPRRFDGSDAPPNIVELCPTCHSALERLYDERFYARLGALGAPEIVNQIIDDVAEDINSAQLELSVLKTDLKDRYQNRTAEELSDGRGDSSSDDGEWFDEDGSDEDDVEVVLEVVKLLTDGEPRSPTPVRAVYSGCKNRGLSADDIDEALDELHHRGDVYWPEGRDGDAIGVVS